MCRDDLRQGEAREIGRIARVDGVQFDGPRHSRQGGEQSFENGGVRKEDRRCLQLRWVETRPPADPPSAQDQGARYASICPVNTKPLVARAEVIQQRSHEPTVEQRVAVVQTGVQLVPGLRKLGESGLGRVDFPSHHGTAPAKCWRVRATAVVIHVI